MNFIQKAVLRIWQKAVGFPPWPNSVGWNLSSPMPSAFAQFFGLGDYLNKISTVYTCCNLLGRRVATLPIDIVESYEGISRPVPNYVGDLLEQPNEYMDKVQFMETMLLMFNLRGNAYAEIVRMGNRITALWPLPADRVTPKFDGRNLRYDVTMPDGVKKPFEPRDILHVRNFSFDGITGLSPLQLHAVRRAGAACDYQENFLKNGARPSLAFSSPKDPTEEAKKRARETAESLYSGPENAGRILFLWGDMKPANISITPEDAQLLEGMHGSMAEVAAAYGVPLNLLNQTDKTATYASAEQFNRYFVDYTLDPLCVRFATAFTSALLNPRLSVKVKFNLQALLAGNSKDQAEYLRTLCAAGIMKINEARAKLNLPPAAGGDDLITQSNQAPTRLLADMAMADKQPAALPPAKMPMNGNNGSKDIDWKAVAQAVDEIRWRASLQ